VKHLAWLVLLAVMTAASALDDAAAADVSDLTFVYGIYGGWSYYAGTSANNGGPAGEWTARVDGRAAVGYFFTPRNWTMTGGSVSSLASLARGYEAAWLIEQFALGTGNDGVPTGWSGGPVTDEDKRAALALAVFEVGMSPTNDPLSLSGGFYSLFFTPSLLVSLGQAYLDALGAASIDEQTLEAKYDIIMGNQWNGNGYAVWVAAIEQPVLSRIDVAPSNTTLHVGEPLRFTAAGTDQFGYPMAFTSIWSASGGPIDATGLYVPTNPGIFEVIAESAVPPVRGTSIVTAAAIPIAGISVGPPFAVGFPSYTTTLYRLHHRSSLMTGDWADLPGDMRGVGGPMSLPDTNGVTEPARFYRLNYFVDP